jgi:two-component system phosphate regulon sensor histidine kinase PhoR
LAIWSPSRHSRLPRRRGAAIADGPREQWSFLASFAAAFLPAILVLAAGLVLGLHLALGWAAVLALGLGGMGLVAATWANHRFLREYRSNLDSAREVLDQLSRGEVPRRIPLSERTFIDPLARSVDQVQDYLTDHFAELSSSRDQLSTVLNAMIEAVIVIDDRQRVVLRNASASRLFRLPAESIGRPLFELVRQPQLLNWVEMTLSAREVAGGELTLTTPTPRTLSVRVQPLPEGSTGGRAMVVATDISQLRRLEEIRQEFVANASHELKTPLASIQACLETLVDGGAIDDHEVRDQFLKMMSEQAERMDHLIRDLLSLTRIENDEADLDLHPVDLGVLVAQSVGRQSQTAERKSIALRVEPPAEPIQPLGDEESLEHILDNLIDNAVKYTDAGGQVIIRWRREGDGCLLEVQDSGIGIPQQHLDRIFERFYRVDRARSREVGGTGLGLSIVKHLVQNQGGDIRVASQMGKGTTFSVRLMTAGRFSR